MYQYGSEAPADDAFVRRMAASLTHRGPDDEGIVVDGRAALAIRRLAIIDPAGGHQPLANEDESVWAVANGEIYNFRELRDDLVQRGHRFRTQTDSEVVVHAYEQYGLDFLNRLDGMFALAVWDRGKRRMLLARDRFGIKPLYLWDDGRCLRFASELKAFLADPTFPREIDPVALDQYLTFQFVPSPRSIFKAVQKLRPGHYALIERGALSVDRFIGAVPRVVAPPDERSALAELEALLAGAVQRQMVSDVPVGALMSGGIDSATVVAIMREISGSRVKTFTVGFDETFARDERDAARRSANLLGAEHHEIAIRAEDCLDSLGPIAWHLDEPLATPSAVPMFFLSRLAASHVKVVLTGQGVDEPWAGYFRYRSEKIGRWYRYLPAALRRGAMTPLAQLLPRAEAVKRFVHAFECDDAAQRFARLYAAFTPEMKRPLYRADRASGMTDGADAARYWHKDVAHLEPLAQQLYVETRLSLPDNLLMYGDKMSMAASLEARVPLLDAQLVQFTESLPAEWRLKGWAGHKYLYRKAIRRWLPEEILNRPKIGFDAPMDQWFRGVLAADLAERIGASGSACGRYFELSYINTMIREHVGGREDYTRPLFALLMFECWHSQFMDASKSSR